MIATNEMTRKITPDNALKLLFPSSKESEILFLATLMIIFVFGDHGLLQLYKLKRERSKIKNHISELRKDREELIKEKAKLENDLKYIEKLAREKYKMAKPGEKVFKVIPRKEEVKN